MRSIYECVYSNMALYLFNYYMIIIIQKKQPFLLKLAQFVELKKSESKLNQFFQTKVKVWRL